MRTRSLSHPLLALAGTVLWGVIEFAALLRVRLTHRAALAKPRA